MSPYTAINKWGTHSRFMQLIQHVHPESEIWEIPPKYADIHLHHLTKNTLFGLL